MFIVKVLAKDKFANNDTHKGFYLHDGVTDVSFYSNETNQHFMRLTTTSVPARVFQVFDTVIVYDESWVERSRYTPYSQPGP